MDRLVIEAARLAGFFLDPTREAEAKADPSLRITAILPFNRDLFVQTATRALILWSHGGGDEKTGEPSADEKWGMLAKRAKEGEIKLERRGDYWAFNRTEMVYTRAGTP